MMLTTNAGHPLVSRSDTNESTTLHRIALDRFRVEREGRVLGYVEVVEPIYVGLMGPTYAHSVEVIQSMDGDSAVRAVVEADRLARLG